MLTKTDLNQIRKIVKQEIRIENEDLKEDLQAEIKLARIEIQKDISRLEERIRKLEVKVDKMQRDIKKIVNFFDRETLQLRSRIERIEDHLTLSHPL